MGVGNDLVKPQMTAGQELTGEFISKIFTQRSVWLVPTEKLPEKSDLNCKEEVLSKTIYHMGVIFGSISLMWLSYPVGLSDASPPPPPGQTIH